MHINYTGFKHFVFHPAHSKLAELPKHPTGLVLGFLNNAQIVCWSMSLFRMDEHGFMP